eukprot:COSAG05_NODE_2072_length_3611_cov_1320.098804_2_plen_446_part_00
MSSEPLLAAGAAVTAAAATAYCCVLLAPYDRVGHPHREGGGTAAAAAKPPAENRRGGQTAAEQPPAKMYTSSSPDDTVTNMKGAYCQHAPRTRGESMRHGEKKTGGQQDEKKEEMGKVGADMQPARQGTDADGSLSYMYSQSHRSWLLQQTALEMPQQTAAGTQPMIDELHTSSVRLAIAGLLHGRLGGAAPAAPWADPDILWVISDYVSLRHAPIKFTAFSEAYSISQQGALLTAMRPAGLRAAICNQETPMQGHHYAEFVEFDSIVARRQGSSGGCVGIGRPNLCIQREHVSGRKDFWGVNMRTGYIESADRLIRWEGMQSFVPGDRIGLLLDCVNGKLTVFKNGTLLGVAVKSAVLQGLDLCWVVAMKRAGQSVRVSARPRELRGVVAEHEAAQLEAAKTMSVACAASVLEAEKQRTRLAIRSFHSERARRGEHELAAGALM